MLPSDVNWSNWNRYYLDRDLWEEPVREVMLRQGYEVKRMRPGFPGTSAAFAVEAELLSTPVTKTLVVKFYPPMVVADYEREIEVRAALREAGSSVPYPRVLASGIYLDHESVTEWPYIIESFSHGQATRDVWTAMDRAERDSIASQAAKIIRELHSTPLSLLPTLRVDANAWRDGARKRLSVCVDEIAALTFPTTTADARLPSSLIAELREFVAERAPRVIDRVDDKSLHLLHNDLTEDHLLVERVPDYERLADQMAPEWRVSALLDYGDSKVGPVMDEWPVLWVGLLEMDAVAFHTFLDAYGMTGVDPDAFLTHTLIHKFNWAIFREAFKRMKAGPATLTGIDALRRVYLPF